MPIICFMDRAGDLNGKFQFGSTGTLLLHTPLFLLSVDFLPINMSINDVLAGISAALGTIRSYLCDTRMCHEGTPRYDEANVRKWETGTSSGLVHFNFWIGCLDEDHSAVVCGLEH